MVILRLARWTWPSYGEARFYGWRHGATFGPWLFFWGAMSREELDLTDDADELRF